MASDNPCGTSGGGSTPCGSKRPGDSLINGSNSAKRPKILFGGAADTSAAPVRSLFGSSDTSNGKPFGGANTSAAATGSIFGSNSPSGARLFGGANTPTATTGALFGTPALSTTGGLFGIPTPAATPSYVYGAPISWGYITPTQAFPLTPNGGFLGSSNSLLQLNSPHSTGGTRTYLFGDATTAMKPNTRSQVI